MPEQVPRPEGPVPDGLREWAALTGPVLVLAEVRRRARNGNRTETGTLRLVLTDEQRRDVARLAGTRWEVSGRPVRLADLAEALAEHGMTVRGLVERLDGRPVELGRDQRAGQAARRQEESAAAAERLTRAGVTAEQAVAWLADPALPRSGSGELLALAGQVADVWRRMRAAEPPRRLAELAALACGDAHALDPDRPLGRATARVSAVVHGVERPRRGGPAWRAAWAAAGVACDEVSSRVLVLNLPLTGTASAARLAAAAPGEPLWLTLRSLDGDWAAPPGTTVFVCENATVVEAAADRWGAGCAPLVCTDGMPALAALTLVKGLAAAGCWLQVRADVDEAGFTIVEQVRSVAPDCTGWRYDADTYRAAIRVEPEPDSAGENGFALRDLWQQAREPLHEEALLDLLLSDLSTEPPCGERSVVDDNGDSSPPGPRVHEQP